MRNIFFLATVLLAILFSLFSDTEAEQQVIPSEIKEAAQQSEMQQADTVFKTPEKAMEDRPTEINTLNNKISREKHFDNSLSPDNAVYNREENIDLRVAKATEWNAYATIAIAMLTIFLAIETVRLRRIQSKQIKNLDEAAIKPKVGLFLDTNKYSINLIEIHVVNNGNGTANNVSFTFEADKNEAVETSNIIIAKIEKINFFKIGLKHLGAGQNKKSFLMSATDSGFGNNDTFFKSTIVATIKCEDDLGKEYTYKYTITMSEFQGIRSIGGDPTNKDRL